MVQAVGARCACSRLRVPDSRMEGQALQRILVVCIGNICRSPTASLLLRHGLAGREVEVSSAGLAAMTAQPIDPYAGAVLEAHGIDASMHRARQLTTEMLRENDLVLAVEKAHVTRMAKLVPEAAGKIFLLDRWSGGRDVPDPYRQSRGTFERVYAMIEQGIAGWQPHLG